MNYEGDLFRMNPNGMEISHALDDYEDVTFVVSNCDDEEAAIQRVRELLDALCQDDNQ